MTLGSSSIQFMTVNRILAAYNLSRECESHLIQESRPRNDRFSVQVSKAFKENKSDRVADLQK